MSDKKSWKELDQMKDRGVRSERKKSSLELRAEKMASKAAKQELEKVFSSGKISKEKAARLEEIKSKRGSPDFYILIQKYCDDFGLPTEWDAQLIVLDHRDKKLVMALLEELKKTAPKEDLDRQKLIIQKLKVMEVSSFDPELISKIAEVKAVFAFG